MRARLLIAAGLILVSACRTRDRGAGTPTVPPAPSAGNPLAPAVASASQPAPKEAELPPTVGSGAPSPAPTPRDETRRAYRVAALGDSITDARMGGGYLKYLEGVCPESLFDNFGKGADMTNQMRRRFESQLIPKVAERAYDTLIFYGGVNDLYSDETASRSNERIEADMSAVFREGKRLGLRIVVLTVSPWGGLTRYFSPKRSDSTRLLNSWILGEARRAEGERLIDVAVDTYPLLSCGRPEFLCPDYETRFHDGIHPGPVGHEIIGRAVHQAAFSDCR